MKKYALISMIIAMVMLCFTSCSKSFSYDDSVYTTYDGVYITVDGIETEGSETILNVSLHNETDGDACYGLGYTVEYNDGGEWKNIQITDFAIPEIACILEAGGVHDRSYSTKYFNMMREGSYRIKIDIYLYEGEESVTVSTYAVFDMEYVK